MASEWGIPVIMDMERDVINNSSYIQMQPGYLYFYLNERQDIVPEQKSLLIPNTSKKMPQQLQELYQLATLRTPSLFSYETLKDSHIVFLVTFQLSRLA